jgi:hypothetical protein
VATILTVTEVEYSGSEPTRALPYETSITESSSTQEIRRTISDVVARADEDYALDLVTALQIKTRLAQDTGKRLSLTEFAEREGFDLAQLRSE